MYIKYIQYVQADTYYIKYILNNRALNRVVHALLKLECAIVSISVSVSVWMNQTWNSLKSMDFINTEPIRSS